MLGLHTVSPVSATSLNRPIRKEETGRIMFLGRSATCFLSSLLFTARMCIITQTAPSDPTCCQMRTACRELSGPEALARSRVRSYSNNRIYSPASNEEHQVIIFKTSHTYNALNQFNPFKAILLQPLAGFLCFSRSVNRRGPLG